MNLNNTKLFYVLSCIILGFVILSPTLFAVIPFPEGEKFSELWILGPNRIIESESFDILENQLYSIYLGVTNNMGAVEFYKVYVKLANLSDPLPNRAAGLASPLQPIFEYNLFLEDNEKSEKEIVFSLEDISFEDNICQITKLSVDDHEVPVDKMIAWDELNPGFHCQLIFELWIYDKTTSDFRFQNRSVWIWLNIIR